jgi:hypothetical protein
LQRLRHNKLDDQTDDHLVNDQQHDDVDNNDDNDQLVNHFEHADHYLELDVICNIVVLYGY